MFDSLFSKRYIIEALVRGRPRTVWGTLIFALYLGGGLISLVAVIWLAVQGWLYGWQTSDWERLRYAFFLLSVPATLIPYGTMFGVLRPARIWRRYSFLCEALLASADDLPEVTPKIEPLPRERLRDKPVRFKTLRRFSGSWYLVWLLSFGLVFPFISISNSLPHALGASSEVADQYSNALFPFVLASFVTPFLFLFVWWLVQHYLQLQVTTDGTGMRWQWGKWGKMQQGAWSAVQAFYRISDVGRGFRTTYVVYFTDGTVLSWRATYVSSDREYRETMRLARIILSRTGKILRDADPFFAGEKATRRQSFSPAQEEGTTRPRVRRTLYGHVSQNLPVAEPFTFTPATQLSEAIETYQRAQVRLMTLLGAVFILLIIMMVPTFVLPDWGVQRSEDMQTAYFASLPGKLHNTSLLYANNLNSNDGLWPVSAAGEQHLAFVDGAYQISGKSGVPDFALIPKQYTNAAVEVTVRQSTPTAQSNAGLAFHVANANANANANEMLLFTVNAADGSWHLYLYQKPYPTMTYQDALDPLLPDYLVPPPGTPMPVHKGLNATNMLLVIMRGPLYLCYVNGIYVGQFTDRYDIYKPPTTGQVGLFVADGSTITTFNNFAIYGVKEPPSLNYL